MSFKISTFEILDSLRKGDGHFNIQVLKGILFQEAASSGGSTRRGDIRRDSLSSGVKERQMLLFLIKRFLELYLWTKYVDILKE